MAAKRLEFLATFRALGFRHMPDLCRQAMYKAGSALLRDAVRDVETVPIDEGTLRGSGSVFVDGVLKEVTPPVNGHGTPATEMAGGKTDSAKVVVTVGFNTPYAARLHEHPEYDFKEPGSGGKYLEKKIAANGKAYMKMVAGILKRGTQHA